MNTKAIEQNVATFRSLKHSIQVSVYDLAKELAKKHKTDDEEVILEKMRAIFGKKNSPMAVLGTDHVERIICVAIEENPFYMAEDVYPPT